MKSYLVVVECILEYKGRILLLERPKGVHAEGLLAFPGGKVEEGDERFQVLEEAVKREVKEEMGIDILDPIRYVCSSFFVDSFGVEVIDVIFYVHLEKSEKEVTASLREAPQWGWYTVDEIEKDPRSPEWLKRYLQVATPLLWRHP